MLIEIEKIKIKDRIRKDFGNIQELADDIKENGLINPPVITPDTYELITGERRIRAMKLLGYKQIEVRPMAVKDAEHQLNLEISENEARKDFSKTERIDYARRLERIESLKAEKRMKIGKADPMETFPQGTTRDIVASKLGIGSGKQYEKEKYIADNRDSLTPEDFADWDEGKLSTNKAFKKIKEEKELLEEQIKKLELSNQNIQNYEKLTYMIPELEELIDTGIVTKTPALAIMNNLSEDEQIELISKLDVTKKYTQQQMQKYIDEIRELKSNPQKPEDYDSTKKELQDYKFDYMQLKTQFDEKVKELQGLRKQIEIMNDNSPVTQYEKKLKDSTLLFCSRIATFIEQVGGYIWLTDKINEIPELEREGYIRSVHAIKSWADTMEYNINNKVKEIN